MATSKGYFEYVSEQLSDAAGVGFRAMMGEYIIYCRGEVVGGLYDDRFLVKQTASAEKLIPDAPLELPYEGAKKMLLVEETDNRAFLEKILNAVAVDLKNAKK